MKKYLLLLLIAVFVTSIAGISEGRTIEEERQAVRDYLSAIDAKIVKYRKAGNTVKVKQLQGEKQGTLRRWEKIKEQLEATPSVTPVAPRPVAPIPTPVKVATTGGAFGWGLNSDISGTYLYNGKGPASGAIGVRMDLVYSDPMALGTWVGLSADAVKYRVGLGGFYGKDNNNETIKAIPLYVDGVIMLPAALLGGVESYIGGGVNYTLYGTWAKSGPYGVQAYYGIMGDLGLGLGKTALEIGYSVVRAGSTDAATARSAKGLTISVCQPFVL